MEDIFEELAATRSDEEGAAEDNDQGGSGNRDDEAEEANDTKRVVKPKRIISRPRPKLDPARLLGPRGIFVVTSTFDGIKFKGKGHELDDLNNVLSRLQHWAHRLFPKMTFEDCIEKIEDLGNKREIQTNMHKIRNGMIDVNSGQPSQDAEDTENVQIPSPEPDNTPFDQLIAAAPAAPQTTLTDEQRARMMRNRLLAEERRMARRLAREKELEEQRAASRIIDENASAGCADSSTSASVINEGIHNDSELMNNEPNTSTSGATSSSRDLGQDNNKPSCTMGDASEKVSTGSDTKTTSASQSMDVSTSAVAEEDTRVLSCESSQCNAGVTSCDELPPDSTDLPKPRQTFMEVDITNDKSAPSNSVQKLKGPSPSLNRSSEACATDDPLSCQLEPKCASAAEELMDVGCAEDWEEAFADEALAPVSQAQTRFLET